MPTSDKPVYIMDVVLRDAHQSLLATRMRTEDMLPIADKLNRAGYWSLEMWGGATFDTMMRFLNEDPWERVRKLKAAMPDTRLQMLLRGQNVVGYRNYADDVLREFVRLAAEAGIDVFRVFDALNDPRNMAEACKAVRENGKWVEGTISYTKSPVHSVPSFLAYAGQLVEMGAQSICIKDMAGLLDPNDAYELVSALKSSYPDVLVHMHSHYTSGMASMSYLKAVEAGADILDCAISSLSMGTSHPPTESMVAALARSSRATGMDIGLLEDISEYFKNVRKKYFGLRECLHGRRPGGAALADPGGHDLEPVVAAQGAGRTRPHARGDAGGAARSPGAGLPAAGHAHLADRGHAGDAERAHGPLQDGHQGDPGLRAGLLRTLAGADRPRDAEADHRRRAAHHHAARRLARTGVAEAPCGVGRTRHQVQ